MNTPLKLIAFDEDDLAIISSYIRASSCYQADMKWLAQKNKFILVFERNVQDFERDTVANTENSHFKTVLHFEHILAVQSRNFENIAQNSPLVIQYLEFHKDEASTLITIHFAKGALLRLKAECIEAQLSDIHAL